ncbi:MAG: MarR family transcriptional regulator [[Clostridium] spiroforme]|uniref:MarR family transcriptional regulator n=1 Tax=Thomasclavelia spiroformis TaxID=29348 RepID=A0A943I5L7_9FIRM|nr:MarR family transcriptional regulator [Thomasclavelia spiroformis]MBS5587620.1 MarR family transcriptional regulator [Thomasclavelia spiroformis]
MDKKKIGAEIRVLANLIGRNLNDINFGDECYNLTGPQTLILAYLYRRQNDDVFQKDIELEFNVRRSSATGVLKCLEANGFIRRESINRDARLKKIILTKKAYKHREVLERHIDELEKILVSGLSQQEIDDLIKILGKIKRNLE